MIVEVAPRDGLQNESVPIPTEVKLRFIAALASAGLTQIEATSFVSPKWVPQLGDAADLWPQLPPGPIYSALVPNIKGLQRAIEAGVTRIAVFTAASEAFTRRNINMSVDESLVAFREVIEHFKRAVPEGEVRGYVSTAFECPYEGRIDPFQVAGVANRLHCLGCYEVSLGDTIGAATPREVDALEQSLRTEYHGRIETIAWHFHDTNGTAIANVARVLERIGPSTFDSSAGGLGGCPYAPGAGGNLATEDLVYFLEREGFSTGVNLDSLARASEEVLARLGRAPTAKAQVSARAVAARQCAT